MTAKLEILHSIRRKCLDCRGGKHSQIRHCAMTECALWRFRFGSDPSPGKPRGVAKPSSGEAVASSSDNMPEWVRRGQELADRFWPKGE